MLRSSVKLKKWVYSVCLNSSGFYKHLEDEKCPWYFPCVYFSVCLTRFKKIIPIPEQSMVQMLCNLLECLLTKDGITADCPKETYELYFVFAAIWAFGGAMVQDQVRDHAEFPTYMQIYHSKRCVLCKDLKTWQLK